MKPITSVLIPSRGKPEQLRKTIDTVARLHSPSATLEIILRLDTDDPKLCDYIADFQNSRNKPDYVLIGHSKGYAGIQGCWRECAHNATGDILLLLNDDVTIQTQCWDEAYRDALRGFPYGIASAYIRTKTDGPADHYEWAMPCVRREFVTAMGYFPGAETIDRVAEAYIRMTGLGVRANVWMVHDYQPAIPGTSRAEVYADHAKNWNEYAKAWNDTALSMKASLIQYLHRTGQPPLWVG